VAPRLAFTRRFWAAAAIAFLVFAAYASLVPFHLRGMPVLTALDIFERALVNPWRLRLSRTDLLANVLLFVPVGFCLAGALRLDRVRWWTGPAAALATLGLSAGWSLLIEFLQVFTVDRTPSPGDVLAQAVGATTGLVAWEVGGTDLTRWLRATLAARTRVERVERALTAYACAWLVVNLAPFDITLDVGTLVGKARSGRIQLVPFPFGGGGGSLWAAAWSLAAHAVAAVPIGALAVVGWTSGATRRRAARAARLALGAVLGLELLQVFVASRTADVNDLLAGGVGAAAGIALASRSSQRRLAGVPPRAERMQTWALAGLVAWCAVLAAYHWRPFDVRLDGAMVRARFAALAWTPFAGYRTGNDLGALTQLVVKASLGAPLGVLCGLAARCAGRWRQLATCGLLSAVALATVEAGQLFLPSRAADPTDVLVGWAGAVAGWALARWIRRGH
jgi:glycopeptide antibiotics resistance protein